jgi:hypothetical protein
VLLFDETDQWIAGCAGSHATDGFVPTGERVDGAPVHWTAPSLQLKHQTLSYDAVKLAMVAATGSYPSADGDVLPILILQDWPTLHKNHPGFVGAHLEEWLGVFVHEAFHARQLWQPRVHVLYKQLASHGTAVPEGLAAFYNANEGFRSAIERECAVMVKALDDPKLDSHIARRALAEWLSLRDQRGAAFAHVMGTAMPEFDPWSMDGFETFVEGTARYVEARFVTSGGHDVDELLASDPTYTHFASSRGKRPTQIKGLQLGPKYFYAVGMYVAFLLDVAEPDWKAHVFDDDGLLVSEARRVAAGGATAAK